ncbi:MAG: hypothetical protein MJ252_01780 [archaeon]|nr:hypothetical protein [archaeon]
MNYFRIPEKFSGNDKKGTQGYLKESEKQCLRKKENPYSRELDNYYNAKIHDRAWMPNGLFIRKKLYEYSEIGLGCHYEKNNVDQKKDIKEVCLRKDQKIKQDYIEYQYLEDNEFNVTIEYCANCEEHISHTRHSPELFKNYAVRIQQCINMRFPFISVMLKPIDTDILQEEVYKKKFPKLVKNGGTYNNRPYINEKFKDVRIGAFEVQITKKNKKGDIETALIHSKLRTGKWPRVKRVLDKIVSFLPNFNGEIHLYQREETESNANNEEEGHEGENTEKGTNPEKNEEEASIYNNKLLGIQVNIYLLRNEKLNNLIKIAENDIEIEMDPRKRMEQILEDRKNAKVSPFCNSSSMTDITAATPFVSRVASAKTRLGRSSSSFFTNRPLSSNRAASAHPLFKNRPISSRPKSSSTAHLSVLSQSGSNFFSQPQNSPRQEVEDKRYSETLKGILLITKYTDREGIVKFGPIPYDSYYVEVVESNEFKFVGSPMVFNKLIPQGERYKKYIGLLIQDDAFVQVHIYQNKIENNIEDQVHLDNATVTVQTYHEGNSTDILSKKEVKYKMNEQREGIFEVMVEVGKYLIEVTRKGYETVRKVCDLTKGLNCINIEMTTVKKFCFKLKAINIVKFFTESKYEFMKNCEVFVYKSSTELLLEGITDKQGDFSFTVDETVTNLTIVMQKLGYRPVQRVFIKTKEVHVNENGEYEQLFNFYMVKDNFFENYNSMLVIAYCNLFDENFEFTGTSKYFILFLGEINSKNIVLNQIGSQSESGVYCVLVEYSKIFFIFIFR